MFDKVGIVAQNVVEGMSRRNFVRRLGAGATGLIAALCGVTANGQQHNKIKSCCYYNCRSVGRSIYIYKSHSGCTGFGGCDGSTTFQGLTCSLIDYRCVQQSQGC